MQTQNPYTAAIISRLESGTLLRNDYTYTDKEGRNFASLLATIAPECGVIKSAEICPTEIMPTWLAYLTPNVIGSKYKCCSKECLEEINWRETLSILGREYIPKEKTETKE